MKCKQCSNELTEYKRSRHVDYVELRLRCDLCGWETVDIINLEKLKGFPKKKYEKEEEE